MEGGFTLNTFKPHNGGSFTSMHGFPFPFKACDEDDDEEKCGGCTFVE